jgi:hypothetical protein
VASSDEALCRVHKKGNHPPEGFVAKWYAQNTARSMEGYAADARRAAALLPAEASMLEVAPGPGYFAVEPAKLGDWRRNDETNGMRHLRPVCPL